MGSDDNLAVQQARVGLFGREEMQEVAEMAVEIGKDFTLLRNPRDTAVRIYQLTQRLQSFVARCLSQGESTPQPEVDKRSVGLYNKFIVKRTDGKSAPGQKHDGCEYFVLDVDHDPHAVAALRAYAESCKAEYPLLAQDVAAKAETCGVGWGRNFALESTPKPSAWQHLSELPIIEPFSDGLRALVYGPRVGIQIAERCGILNGYITGSIPGFHGSLIEWGVEAWQPLPLSPLAEASQQAQESPQ